MLRALSEAGYSDTASRRAVVEVLCASSAGATPAELLSRGKASHPRLGQVTVYRTLEILEHMGMVRKLHQEDGCSSWVATGAEHGHHVICRKCRKAVEFEGCSLGEVLSEASRRTGYTVEGHWLELFGLCPACRRKE
jgi:Fur family ferric uptake transcriptional regulator